MNIATRNLDQYAEIHRTKAYGRGNADARGVLAPLVLLRNPRSILDYGAGQSRSVDLYFAPRAAIRHRYDPAIPAISKIPLDRYDLVTCTDVLEHIDEPEIPALLAHIGSLTDHALLVVDTRPASTVLPNGENAYATVSPPEWWLARLREHFPEAELFRYSDDQAFFRTWRVSAAKRLAYRLLRAPLRAAMPKKTAPPAADFGIPALYGRTLVLGSGPGARPPEGFTDGWNLATVNASQVIASQWTARRPHLTLFGTAVLGSKDVNREARKVLFGRRTGTLVCIDSKFKRTLKLRLALLGYRHSRLCRLTREQRDEIITHALGEKASGLKPSNGIFLALLCLRLGASEVVMTGFSLTKAGHAYNDKNRLRGHVDADRAALDLALERGLPISANDPDFALESGLPLAATAPARS